MSNISTNLASFRIFYYFLYFEIICPSITFWCIFSLLASGLFGSVILSGIGRSEGSSQLRVSPSSSLPSISIVSNLGHSGFAVVAAAVFFSSLFYGFILVWGVLTEVYSRLESFNSNVSIKNLTKRYTSFLLEITLVFSSLCGCSENAFLCSHDPSALNAAFPYLFELLICSTWLF